jgi:outer membrane protein TolC
MNRIIIFMIFMVWGLVAWSQESVTLEMCYSKALENYPLAKQNELLPQSHDIRIKNLNKNYMPQMAVNGQAHYQSDVTKTPIQNIPGINIPTVEKDWYKVSLDVTQTIYDGSNTSRQKDVEDISLEIDKQGLDIEFYKLKERINQVYFNLLLLKEKAKILELHRSNLTSKLKDVESGVRNGTLLSSNEDVLKAEIIRAEQAIAEVKISLKAGIGMLNEFTGLTMNEETGFLLPEVSVNLNTYTNNRPEYFLFSLQQDKLTASKKLTGTSLLPRFSAFGQAGYGRPGYDMLNVNFDDFYMIGARLSWKPWDWNLSRKQKEVLDIQNEIINSQKETFDKNVKIDLENKIAEIRKAEELISRDRELIELREKISKSVSSQLDNGVITSSQYLTEINAEASARLDLESHKIQLIKAKLDYQATIGNL